MRFVLFVVLLSLLMPQDANAQFAAQNEAKYIATLKAVVNIKIDDEENIAAVEQLRENQTFNRELLRMIEKLQNTRTKNSTNRKVYNILLKAGKEVYDELKY